MKKKCTQIVGVILIIILLFSTNLSLAVTQSEINAQKNEQNKINNQIDKAEEKHKELESKKSEIQKQVENLGSQIQEYENQIAELDNKINEANTKIKEAEAKLEQNQKEYNRKEEMCKQRLVAVYEAGETSYLDFLLSSSSLTEFISNYFLITELADMDARLMEQLEKEKEEIEKSRQEIVSSKKTLTESKASKESVATQLKSAKSEKDNYVAQLSEEEKELEKEIQELKATNAKIANEIKEAERKYAEQLKELENNSSNNSSSSSGYLASPVSGPITAYAYYSSGKFHGAIDYGVSVGTPVYAAADGVVMSTANLSTSYGTYVVIRHGNGLQSYYAHGTYGSICVSPGQVVKKGQKIMSSGNTGNSSGPHLHFEVRKSPYNYNGYAKAYGQDSRVNPLAYM